MLSCTFPPPAPQPTETPGADPRTCPRCEPLALFAAAPLEAPLGTEARAHRRDAVRERGICGSPRRQRGLDLKQLCLQRRRRLETDSVTNMHVLRTKAGAGMVGLSVLASICFMTSRFDKSHVPALKQWAQRRPPRCSPRPNTVSRTTRATNIVWDVRPARQDAHVTTMRVQDNLNLGARSDVEPGRQQEPTRSARAGGCLCNDKTESGD